MTLIKIEFLRFNYLYHTKINFSSSRIYLRKSPSSNSKMMTSSCSSQSIVYVIERTNSKFYKISIDGKIGYISVTFLKQK